MALIRCCFETDAQEVFESVVKKCTDPGCKYTKKINFEIFLID